MTYPHPSGEPVDRLLHLLDEQLGNLYVKPVETTISLKDVETIKHAVNHIRACSYRRGCSICIYLEGKFHRVLRAWHARVPLAGEILKVEALSGKGFDRFYVSQVETLEASHQDVTIHLHCFPFERGEE